MEPQQKKSCISLTEAVLQLRAESIFPFYCIIALFRLVRKNFVPSYYVKKILFNEKCPQNRVLSFLQARPLLTHVYVVEPDVNDEIVRHITTDRTELYDLAMKINHPIDFNTFTSNLATNSKSLMFLRFHRSDIINDDAVNCILMNLQNLVMISAFECNRIRHKPTVRTQCLLQFESCGALGLQDVPEIIFHNMKTGKTDEMIKSSLKYYFTDEAWTDFETKYYQKVLEENESYRFCSYTIHGFFHYSILNLVCAITSEDFRFFRVKEHPFPAVYILQWAKKEAARNFFFYQNMSHLLEG